MYLLYRSIPLLVTVALFSLEFTTCSNILENENRVSDLKPSAGYQIIDPNVSSSRSNFTVRCGETHSTTSGNVFYKPFQAIGDHERCAWIIGVPGALGYDIELQYLGSPTNEQGSGQELILTGVRHANQTEPILSSYRPESTGVFRMSDVNIIIVSFNSARQNGEPSTGFSLRYEGLQYGNISKTSSSSAHHLLNHTQFEWKYPVSTTSYTAGELAAFVLPPQNNYYKGSENHGWYKKGGIAAGCLDAIFVYHFFTAPSMVNTTGWELSDTICSETNQLHFTYDDMVLLLFRSGVTSSTTRTGFWLTAVACQC